MHPFVKKVLYNLHCDKEWIFARSLNLSDKLVYLQRKYISILKNSGNINYLGRKFFYDNRFSPALLQIYPSEIERLDNYINLKNISSTLDIGANIGQFAFTLKRLFPKLNIYSFEPNKSIFSILERNSSKLQGWKVYNLGVDLKKGKREFYYSPSSSAEGSFYKENTHQNYLRNDIIKSSVNITNLDNRELKRFSLPNHFDLVKIDVEGAELEVLKSLKNINFNYLFIEVSVNRSTGATLKDIINLLEKSWKKKVKLLNYDIYNKDSPAATAILSVK